MRAKLPGCRYPGVAARRAQGGADAQVQPQLKLNRGDPIHCEFTLVKCSQSARAFSKTKKCASSGCIPGLLHPAGGVPGPARRFTLSWVPVATVP